MFAIEVSCYYVNSSNFFIFNVSEMESEVLLCMYMCVCMKTLMLAAHNVLSFLPCLLSGLSAPLCGVDPPELLNLHVCGSGAEEGTDQAAAGVM